MSSSAKISPRRSACPLFSHKKKIAGSGCCSANFSLFNCSKYVLLHSYVLSKDRNFSNYGYQLKSKIPDNSTYSAGIKQHTIFFHPQEAYPLPDGRLGYIVIDQNGEIR